ncbi:MAG: toll/interleukin-1 receptor domain-containing protein [Candidatus Odinarchaeota archaeon]
MVKIFISHSTKDFRFVIGLGKYLNTYGIETYIAERDYQPGKPLSQKIMRNIDLCDYFSVVYTINGDDSKFVHQEIGYWLGRKKYNDLIPLVTKGLNPKAFLHDVEYIEFDPLDPKSAMDNLIYYMNQQFKIKKKKVLFDIGVGLGIIGITTLILWGISRLSKE